MTLNPIHNVIKIKYAEEGYLPNYPYHLISDKEMFEAFLGEDIIEEHHHVDHSTCFLKDFYPLPDESLKKQYDELVGDMRNHIKEYIESDKKVEVPDWVYSYMLGVVINHHSSVEDRHYLLTMLGMDNLMDDILVSHNRKMLQISKKWIEKNLDIRKPTMFGEPHVIKALRLEQIDSLY